MDDLIGSIKLDGETVFYHYISQDKEKSEIYDRYSEWELKFKSN